MRREMQTVYEHHYAELQKKKGEQKNSGKLSDLNTLCHRDSTGVVILFPLTTRK